MNTTPLSTALKCLCTEAACHATEERSDVALLHAYAATNDQAAFAALVRRHGPLVLGVCRRVLQDAHDAEDAFQAVFLVLARKAAALRNGAALTSWLHGVSYRIALSAQRDTARRRRHESRVTPRTPPPAWEVGWRELQGILDEEVERLPPAFRATFVLCCLEGLSKAEAAGRLGLKENTVSSRLARARKRLQERLTRRGISLTAVLAALAVSGVGQAAVPLRSACATVAAATRFGAGASVTGLSARALSLAEGVTPMLSNKSKLASVVLVVLAALGTGLGLFARPAADKPAALPVIKAPPAKKPGDETIAVNGRVLAPDGKPLAGAKVYLSPRTEQDRTPPKVRARSGPDGHFRISVARSDVDRGETVVAVAEGCGPDWAELCTLDRDGRLPALRLVKDMPIAGRVLDLEARPIRNATVRVIRLRKMPDEDLTPWVKDIVVDASKGLLDVTKTRKLLQYERLLKTVRGVPGRKAAVTTDADGRFQLKGFGRERIVELAIEGPTIERRHVVILTRKETPKGLPPFTYGARFDHLAAAPKPITGTVRDKVSGRPVSGLQVACVLLSPGGVLTDLVAANIQTTTDERGRYRLLGVPKAKQYHLAASGGAYFASSLVVRDTPGRDPIAADFALERGLLVQGRLIDKATRKPLRGRIFYVVPPDNPHLKDYPGFAKYSVNMTETAGDGAFRVAVVPGPGLICARAREDRFVRGEAPGSGAKPPPFLEVFLTVSPFHAIVSVNASEKQPRSLTCPIALDPGQTLSGTVDGPDGKPLSGAFVAGLGAAFSATDGTPSRTRLPTAAFTVVGLSARRPRTLVFWHEEKKLARAVLVKETESAPLTVRLESLGAATGRLLDAKGLPQPGGKVQARYSSRQNRTLPGELSLAYPAIIRPALPVPEATTDRDGRFHLQGLIPGMKYDVVVVADGKVVATLVEDASFPSGAAKDLGDSKAPSRAK